MGVANHRIDRYSHPYRHRHYELYGHLKNYPRSEMNQSGDFPFLRGFQDAYSDILTMSVVSQRRRISIILSSSKEMQPPVYGL